MADNEYKGDGCGGCGCGFLIMIIWIILITFSISILIKGYESKSLWKGAVMVTKEYYDVADSVWNNKDE